MQSANTNAIEGGNLMKAFITSLVGIAIFSGVAWFVLEQVDWSSETVNQSSTGSVRLD